MSTLLCVCLIGAMFAGCGKDTDAPLAGSVFSDGGNNVELVSMNEDGGNFNVELVSMNEDGGNFTIITKRGASSSSPG